MNLSDSDHLHQILLWTETLGELTHLLKEILFLWGAYWHSLSAEVDPVVAWHHGSGLDSHLGLLRSTLGGSIHHY